MARYFVTDPVKGDQGYAYYDVRDREDGYMPNFAVATFFKRIQNARDEAYGLCARLNGGDGK